MSDSRERSQGIDQLFEGIFEDPVADEKEVDQGYHSDTSIKKLHFESVFGALAASTYRSMKMFD